MGPITMKLLADLSGLSTRRFERLERLCRVIRRTSHLLSHTEKCGGLARRWRSRKSCQQTCNRLGRPLYLLVFESICLTTEQRSNNHDNRTESGSGHNGEPGVWSAPPNSSQTHGQSETGHLLTGPALVNEVVVRFLTDSAMPTEDRAPFNAYAAAVMEVSVFTVKRDSDGSRHWLKNQISNDSR